MDMKTIVITGSTRGIGLGLAQAFLDLDCQVVVSGRSQAAIDRALAQLTKPGRDDRIYGIPCDVSDFAQVEALWRKAVERFGKVDIWINNAGQAHPQKDFWQLTPDELRSVVTTNILGAMYGSKVAITGMLVQGYGALYNMEGLGSSGPRVKGMSLYGTSKAALRYLDDSLMEDVKGTPILVGALRPGMVATEMLSGQYQGEPAKWESAKRIFNILADRVETVAPWLAQQILANQKSGVRISWSNSFRTLSRFLLAPFRKRNVFEER